ncbi:hypothetical protein F5Y13DRAFT_13810 [Hypoxylon sp. FL1857]|nr:hypothetical protein F5Y13DRAFT_13810 [Hypoxylon sp. FL1857]
MSRRSALSAFCASNGALECAARRIAGSSQRTFSSSSRRDAGMSHFTQTSSPELDELLSTIRHKIILPSYLPTEQRKKIFSSKYEKTLQSDPIIIEIDGEVFKFRHLNPSKDMPQTRRSVVTAISQFSTPADFANLRPLLEGIAYANRKFKSSFYCKVLRVVGEKGHIYDIIECARGVARTGFKLDSSEKANEILHFVQMKAVESGWDEAVTVKALRWAEMVLELMQQEEHQPKRRKDEHMLEGELPLYRDPMVLLAPLHLVAALVAKRGPEADPELVEKLNKYARDIVRLWPEGKKLTEVQPSALYEEYDKMGYLLPPSKFVALTTPLLYGLETAIQVVSPELASQLQSRRDILDKEVGGARAAAAQKAAARMAAAQMDGAQMTETRAETVLRKVYHNEAWREDQRRLEEEQRQLEEQEAGPA